LTADPAGKLDVPPAWEAAAEEIFQRRLRTVLVVGEAAVGKSSFCRYLAGALLARQAQVAFVDADIGQSNMGPPAAVTLGYPDSPVDFAAVVPAAYSFVGSTSPIGRFLPLVIGTARLAREAQGAFVIVDTTGLVHEAGRVLKNYKIEAVGPDVIVAIERRSELAAIRMANRHVPIIKIEPSRRAHGKDDYDKIDTRRRSYARHFAGATLLDLPLASLIFQRTLLFAGDPIELEGAMLFWLSARRSRRRPTASFCLQASSAICSPGSPMRAGAVGGSGSSSALTLPKARSQSRPRSSATRSGSSSSATSTSPRTAASLER